MMAVRASWLEWCGAARNVAPVGSVFRVLPSGPRLPWSRPHELGVHDPLSLREDPQASDEALLARCRRGDPFAWRALVRRYARLVYGIARTMGLQPADADEVFQDSFEALLRSIHRIREPRRLDAWLVTTSRRASLRLLREERRRLRMAQHAAGEASTSMETDLDARLERLQEEERVRRALEALPEPCRTILIALFAERPRSYEEIARGIGLARGSIGATRTRCIERLRRQLLKDAPAREKNGGVR